MGDKYLDVIRYQENNYIVIPEYITEDADVSDFTLEFRDDLACGNGDIEIIRLSLEEVELISTNKEMNVLIVKEFGEE